MATALESASTPVLRVKRRRSKSPASAFVLHLSSKRRKENLNDADENPADKEAVFKFTGTVDNPRDTLRIVRKTKEENPKNVKRIVEKNKAKPCKKAEAAEKRYKVVSALRGLDKASDDGREEADRLFNLVDVVEDEHDGSGLTQYDVETEKACDEGIACNGVAMVAKATTAEVDYVYDVYTMQGEHAPSTSHFDALDITDIRHLDCRDLVHDGDDDDDDWRAFRDNGDDSDSNDEGHWKNDYPDEDYDDEDDVYYRDEDIDVDFDKFHLKYGNPEVDDDSSNDSSDMDELVYTRPSDYGGGYASYKKKMMAELRGKVGGDDGDDDSVDIDDEDEFN